MPYQKPPITSKKDRFIGYCAVTPNRKFMKLFERADVKNILISFHYIRKDKVFTNDILQMVQERGGLFMTDSGAFSFLNDKSFDPKSFDWLNYLEEYVGWIDDNTKHVFSACNLDVDYYVGHDEVVKWNKKYFEPLGERTNIIYVAHQNAKGMGDLDALKEYCKEYDYVAVNERMTKYASSIYQEAKLTKTAIHGLAWTKPTILTDFPFFSVDSSSWVNYQKYGATPVWDGKNFSQYDKDNKDIRKTLRKQCVNYGIKEYEFVHEKNEDTGTHNDDEGLTYSLRTWLDVFQSIKRFAKTKLTIDVAKMLEGKDTQFIEDASGDPQVPKRSRLASIIDDNDDIISTPVAKTTFAVDENGEEVAIYEKRDGKIAINEFTAKSGDAMVCTYCHIQDKCPKYKEDSTCAFDFAPASFTESPMVVIDLLIKTQTERVNRAMFFEKMEGGMPNKVFTQELKTLEGLNNTKTNMLLMMQSRGLRITQTTVEVGGTLEGADKPQEKKPGFADMLTSLMGKK